MKGFYEEYNKRENGPDPIGANYLNEQMGKFKKFIEDVAAQIKPQFSLQDLEKLADLHTKGILSDDEFKSAKERILK
jgi:hypothetical protein